MTDDNKRTPARFCQGGSRGPYRQISFQEEPQIRTFSENSISTKPSWTLLCALFLDQLTYGDRGSEGLAQGPWVKGPAGYQPGSLRPPQLSALFLHGRSRSLAEG